MRVRQPGTGKRMHPTRATYIALVALALSAVAARSAAADDSWWPFRERDDAPAASSARDAERGRPFLPAMGGWMPPQELPPQHGWTDPDWPSTAVERGEPPPINSKSWAVDRAELAPVMASDGSALPLELWRGLDLAAVENLMATLEAPPRSPALHALWRRMLISEATAPAGATPDQFVAVKAEALYRSGLLRDASVLLAKSAPAQPDAIATAFKARIDIALGNREAGCEAAKAGGGRKLELPKPLQGEVLVLAGYCAAATGNAAAAGLAAELAREEGYNTPVALAALDALAFGHKPRFSLPKRLTPVEYRMLQLAGGDERAAVLERADAALLAALVQDSTTDPKLRAAAAEAAARINVLAPAELAEIYRSQMVPTVEHVEPLSGQPDPLVRRAQLFQSAERERAPLQKARIIRTFLDDARREGFYFHAMRMLAHLVEDLPQAPDTGWFAETAIEIMLAAGQPERARAWATFHMPHDRGAAGPGLQHWLALSDIADPDLKTPRGTALASVEDLALLGRFDADALHRLATVLDALDYNVPIALWEMASKTPQPNNGHLPETGVLAELLDASKKREFGRTLLLALHTLGPGGAETAHIIALGDAIRALKRAGLESDARRLAFEALFSSWPRLLDH
jgi:hypothetical protein